MFLIVLLACAIHKTTLTGIVDVINENSCMIELSSGKIVALESSLCQKLKEGEAIYFYISD